VSGPPTDDDKASALQGAKNFLTMCARRGLLRAGVQNEPDHELRSKARIELTLPAAGWEGELPEDVRAYLHRLVSEDVAPPSQKGRRKNEVRDQTLAMVVDFIVEAYGINPTRQPESKHRRQESACSIVARALDDLGVRPRVSEDTLRKVWARYRSEPGKVGWTK
jgi:hypothetical protein